jgi:hypothetical protein
MYPDGYPAAILIKRKLVFVVNSFEPPRQRIDQPHSKAPRCEEENGILLFPFLLSVATCVRRLRYLLPWVLWYEERETYVLRKK